jgi:hypothetical protein
VKLKNICATLRAAGMPEAMILKEAKRIQKTLQDKA